MSELQTLDKRITAALEEFVETKKSSSKVVSDFTPIIKTTSELPLVNLEYWERYIREEYDNALASGYSSKWKLWDRNTPPITLLDLCSWDGYRREKAVRAIREKVPNRFFLALVLRRLNDWVPQVRQAAQEILSKVLVNTEPSCVAEVICFTLSHWSSWKRIENSAREAFLDTLSSQESAPRKLDETFGGLYMNQDTLNFLN